MNLRGVVLFVFLCAVGSNVCAMERVPMMEMESPLLGRTAPNFKLKLLSGPTKSLQEFSEGRHAILFFWATWCPHCRSQIQELKGNLKSITSKGIKVVLINVGEEAQKVKSYLDYSKLDLDVFMDVDSEISMQYGVYGLPAFYFVNKKGEIVGVDHYIPENYGEMFAP